MKCRKLGKNLISKGQLEIRYYIKMINQSLKDDPPEAQLTSESNLAGVNSLVTSPLLYQLTYRKSVLLIMHIVPITSI